jgi:hypothetical protein
MIIEQLRDDLVEAGLRHQAPPRRRLPFAVPVAGVLAAAVVAVLVVRGEAEREIVVPEPRAGTASLVVPGVEPALRYVVRRMPDGSLCQTASRDPRMRRCMGGFGLAGSFAENGAPATYSVARAGGAYVVHGLADASVRSVEVHSPVGIRRAVVSERTLRVPVERRDTSGMTAEGRRAARSFPDELRVRPYAVALPLASRPEMTLVLDSGAIRIPRGSVPAISAPQRRRISLLERDPQGKDAAAAAQLRRAGKSDDVAASARSGFRFQDRDVFAYVNRIGRVCIVGAGGTGCTRRESAVTDEPLVVSSMTSRDDRVRTVGLLHDGPRWVEIERRDGTTRTVPVSGNLFAFEDRAVVRLHWEGLRGRATLQIDP